MHEGLYYNTFTNIYKTISLVVCIDVLIPLVAYTDAARFWCATFMIDLIS